MERQESTNEFCPRCKYADRGLNEYPCRCCTMAHALANHFDPVDGSVSGGPVTKIVSMLDGPYDRATVYLDCAVQVLENTRTGETSVGWTRSPEVIEQWRQNAEETEGAFELES